MNSLTRLSLPGSLIAGLIITGCTGSDESTELDRCSNAFNTSAPIQEELADFRVDVDDGERIDLTWSHSFLTAIHPADASDPDVAAVAGELDSLFDRFLNFERADDGSVASLLNDQDLIQFLISTDRLENVRAGRQAVAGCIDDDRAANFTNNNVELQEVEGGEVERSWFYTIRYNFLSLEDEVTRVFQGLTNSTSHFASYPSDSFSGLGFNRPKIAFVTHFPVETGQEDMADTDTLSLFQDWEERRDLVAWLEMTDPDTGEVTGPGRTLDAQLLNEPAGQVYTYLLTRYDYATDTLRLYGSTVRDPATMDDLGVPNESGRGPVGGRPGDCQADAFDEAESVDRCIRALEALGQANPDSGGLLMEYTGTSVPDRQ